MIGWSELEADVEMLRDVKNHCCLDVYKMETTVPTEKDLQRLAFLCLREGFEVKLHTTSFITIFGGMNDERVIEVRVRS